MHLAFGDTRAFTARAGEGRARMPQKNSMPLFAGLDCGILVELENVPSSKGGPPLLTRGGGLLSYFVLCYQQMY